jgi:hypothetical protein
MLANDRVGDCVIAMMLHSIESFHLDAGTTPPSFTDEDALMLYSDITGYVPGDPNTDHGTNEADAMAAWERGLPRTSDNARHTIVGTVAVDPTNLTEVKVAIDEFGALQLAVALPVTAQGQSEWKIVGDPVTDPDAAPGSWGGHGIPAREYDPETLSVVTWAKEILVTNEFFRTYMVEAHVVVTQEMLGRSGVGPSGLKWDDLVADIRQFQAA